MRRVICLRPIVSLNSPMPDPIPQIIITFPRSRSPMFPLSLDLAKRIEVEGHGTYEERRLSAGQRRLPVYQVTLRRVTPASALCLAELVRSLSSRGPSMTVNGCRLTWLRVAPVLDCYLRSCAVSDWRAYCWVPARNPFNTFPRLPLTVRLSLSLTDPSPSPDARTAQGNQDHPVTAHSDWFAPCQRIHRYIAALMRDAHPAGLRAQVEALLAREECHWCPRVQHLDEWDLLQWGRVR